MQDGFGKWLKTKALYVYLSEFSMHVITRG